MEGIERSTHSPGSRYAQVNAFSVARLALSRRGIGETREATSKENESSRKSDHRVERGC